MSAPGSDADDGADVTLERPASGFDRMAGIHDVTITRGEPAPSTDPLALHHRLPIEGLAPAEGTINALTLTLALEIGIILAGSVGDGLPLNEAGEEVATAVSLPLTLSVMGPEGHLLAARSLEALTAHCTGMRACAYASTARIPVKIAMTPLNHAAFANAGYLDLGLEPDREVVETFCPEDALWERCVIESVMLRLSSPDGGVNLTFNYRPDASPGALASGLWGAEAILVIGFAGLTLAAVTGLVIRRAGRHHA